MSEITTPARRIARVLPTYPRGIELRFDRDGQLVEARQKGTWHANPAHEPEYFYRANGTAGQAVPQRAVQDRIDALNEAATRYTVWSEVEEYADDLQAIA